MIRIKFIVFILCMTFFCLSSCDSSQDQIQNPNTQTKNNKSTQSKKELSTDICSQFPKDLVASAIGKPVIKTESQSGGGSYTCQYFIDETHFASITLSNLSVENQKKGAKMMKRKLEEDSRIQMEHFLTVQEDGNINAIYLVLGSHQFLRIDRNSGKAIDNQTLIHIAIKVAENI